MSAEEHAQLSALAASRALPHALVARVKLVLSAAQCESNTAIAERLGWSLPLSFLNHLDRNVPADLEVHLIADNYATHKHPRVKAWLARHPRFVNPLHADLLPLAQPS